VPFLNFAPLDNAVAALDQAVERYQDAEKARTAGGTALAPAEQAKLDLILMKTERALLRKEGLPRRPWYRHYLYAPGNYTGYGVKTLPAVREAIEQRDFTEAGSEIETLAGVLDRLTAEVDKATAVMKPN
jgi:N-acetylated-alpha-linked acidic dipeptidase